MRTCILFLSVCIPCIGAELLSRVSTVSQTAAGASSAPVISPDGSYVVFVSSAGNLAADSAGGALKLFRRDLVSDETRLISLAHSNAGYASMAAPLIVYAAEVNGISHIFLYDEQTATHRQITAGSLASHNGPPPNGSSRPILTPDARWVLFESSATNLTADLDANSLPDLFLHDTESGSNILVSAGSVARGGAAPRQRFQGCVTPDGSRVAFVSRNITPPTSNTAVRAEVFVRNVQDGSLTWGSANVESILGQDLDYICSYPLLTPDSSMLFFKAAVSGRATNAFVLSHNLQTRETSILASNSVLQAPAALSADGRYLVYDSGGQIFRSDREAEGNQLVSVNAAGTGPANGLCLNPVTQDGFAIAFVSAATNLVGSGSPAGTYQVYLRDMVAGTTRLGSVNTNGQPARRSLVSAYPQLDASGTRVVFDYAGSDLVADDLNEASDVFLFDTTSGIVRLLSPALPELPAISRPRGAAPELSSISADGQKVTFTAFFANNREVYVADLASGFLRPVSTADRFVGRRASQGVISGDGKFALYFRDDNSSTSTWGVALRLFRRNLQVGGFDEVDFNSGYAMDLLIGRTFYPAISHDGNLVVYPMSGNLHLRDMIAGTNRVVAQSHLTGRALPMINPKFTPDHRWVLFQHAYAANITTNTWLSEPQGQYNLFARDLHSTNIILLSASATGVGLGTATATSISANSRYAAYDVWLGNRRPAVTNVYVYDFTTYANTLICSNCSQPSLSGDGRNIAYARRRQGSSIDDIYVEDRTSGAMIRIAEGIPNGSSGRPLLSADGRYVVFSSAASNWVPNDNNGAEDVFLHDRYRGETYRLSPGNAASRRHIMSQNGRTVVFQSLAGDLSPEDYNEALDIFAVTLGAGDFDNDGMDDAWEVTYFNDISRNGSGDSDADGHSDLQEFIAGTDPTNAGSVLEVVAIRSLSPNQVRILWSGTVGKRYVIQTKEFLDSPSWTTVSDPIAADTTMMSWDLASAVSTAFYRVVLVH